MWLRDSWSEVVGTQGVVAAHHARGVDVAVAFWTDEVARTKSRVEVAAYLAGESAKWAQKKPPEGFVRVGRYYGIVGKKLGFKPVEEPLVVGDAVAYEIERRLVGLCVGGSGRSARGTGIRDRSTSIVVVPETDWWPSVSARGCSEAAGTVRACCCAKGSRERGGEPVRVGSDVPRLGTRCACYRSAARTAMRGSGERGGGRGMHAEASLAVATTMKSAKSARRGQRAAPLGGQLHVPGFRGMRRLRRSRGSLNDECA